MAKDGHFVDLAVGARIRRARTALGWSLRRLADATGKQPAELSEYERGIRAMRLFSLWRVSRALRKPIAWFFKEVKDEAGKK